MDPAALEYLPLAAVVVPAERSATSYVCPAATVNNSGNWLMRG